MRPALNQSGICFNNYVAAGLTTRNEINNFCGYATQITKCDPSRECILFIYVSLTRYEIPVLGMGNNNNSRLII